MDEQRLKGFVSGLGPLVQLRLLEIEALNKNDRKAYAEVLKQQAEQVPDDAEKDWLWFRAGELYIELADKEQANSSFEKISKTPEWKTLSLLVLEENARFENDLPRLARLYEERAKISGPEQARALALVRARLLAFSAGDRKGAEEILDSLAQSDADSLAVLLTRVQLYLEEGDWKKLADTYKNLFDLGEKNQDPLVSASYAYRIGALMEGRIGSPLAALDWYGKLFSGKAALYALPPAIEILESLKQNKDLRFALQKFAELVPEDERWLKALLLFRQSQLSEIDNDKDGELELLKKVVELDPENLLALFRLEAIARNNRDHALLAACLEAICKCLAKGELKLFYLTELAQVYLDLLDEPERCERILAQAQELSENSLALLRLRQALAFRRRDWAAMSSALSEEIKTSEDPKELQALLIKKAESLLYGTEDLKQAESNYRQALEIAPSQFPFLRSLEQILNRAHDFEGYLRILLVMEKLVIPEDNRVYYAGRRAFISELGLGKAELAVAGMSDIIRLKPDRVSALFSLVRILREKRAGENYIRAVDRILTVASGSPEYPFMLFQAAWDFENLFNQPEKAQELWQKFYAQKFAFPALLNEQRRLSYKYRDWKQLEEIWLKITEKISSAEIATSFLLRTGFLAETFLGEPGQARAAYERALNQGSMPVTYPALIELSCFQGDFQSASALFKDFARKLSKPFRAGFVWQSAMMLWEKGKSDNERVLEELKQADEAGAGWLAKTSRLEFLRRQGDYQLLSRGLEEFLSITEESKLLPFELEYAWTLSRRAGQKDRAIEQFLKVLSSNDNYLPVLRELELLAAETKHPKLMVQTLSRELPARSDPEMITLIHHWLALVYEQDLNDQEHAVASLRALLKFKPDWLPAISELRRLYEETKSYKELAKIISMELPLVEDPARKQELIKQQAELYEQNLSSPDSAVNVLLYAHSLNPGNSEILASLARLYLQMEKWPELIDVIEKEIKLSPDPNQQAELQVQVGQLYDEKLSNFEKAAASYEQAEKVLPEFMPLLRSLERLYQKLGRWRELVRVLEKISSLVSTKNEQAEFINRAGKIYYEQLKEPEPAISSHLKVLSIAPENQAALESLVLLYREKKDIANLVTCQEKLAEQFQKGKPDLARNLYLEIGAVCEKELMDEERAIKCYRKASALAPGDLKPLRAERSIYERRQDWKEVMRLMEGEVKIASAPEDKKEILAAIGALNEQKLSSPEAAAGFYQAALKLDPEYLPAVKPLSEILFKAANWDEAEPLYLTWVKYLNKEAPERQAEILYSLGVVEEKLGKAEKALECFQGASHIKPHYLEPLARLFELYLGKGDKQNALGAGQELAAALEQSGDRKLLFSTLNRMGALERELGSGEEAIEYLERALTIEPNHYPTIKVLIELYTAKKNWPKTLSSYDRLVRAAGNPELVCQGLLEKGEILENQLNQRESAIAHYKKAVQVKSDSLPGWSYLANALKQERKWNDAAEAFERILSLEQDPKNKIEDYYTLGIIYRDGFGDMDRAKVNFEQALNLNKTHVPSMEAILSIYLKQKQWDKYADLSQRFISLLPKGEESKSASLHYQRAQVFRDFLNDKQKAIVEFQAALKLNPEDIQSRIELAELFSKDTNYYPHALRENQEIISLQPFRVESYHQMGWIYENLGKLDEAFCCYKALEFFKAADRDENMFLEANNQHVAKSSSKVLTDDMQYRMLAHPDCRGALLELIAEVGDYLSDILPPQLEKTGAGRSNKLPSNSPSPLKKMADEMAVNLNIPSYELYLISQAAEPKVVATDPPSLVLSQDSMNKLSQDERRFVIGKYMAHMKLRHGLIFNHPLPEVFKAVMLFVWLVVPEAKVPGVAEADLERAAKPIKRAVPRKVRAALEDKAKFLAREGLPKDTAKWLRAVNLTGQYAGMLFCNDLTESLSAALKFDSRFKQVNLKDLADPKLVLEQSEDAKELLRYWVSDAYFALRKRSGFSLLSS